MKKLILLLAILLPVIANAMKISKDEVDEFTGRRTVITSWESFNHKNIHIRFRLQNGNQFLDFKYINGEPIVIVEDASLMFKSTSDAITDFKSIATYSGGIGDGATGLLSSGVWGISASYQGDISWFLANTTILIRLYQTEGYEDKKFSEKEGKKLTDLANLFLTTISDAK